MPSPLLAVSSSERRPLRCRSFALGLHSFTKQILLTSNFSFFRARGSVLTNKNKLKIYPIEKKATLFLSVLAPSASSSIHFTFFVLRLPCSGSTRRRTSENEGRTQSVGNHSFASPSSHFRKTTANKDGCRAFEKISYCFTLHLLHLLFGFLVRALSLSRFVYRLRSLLCRSMRVHITAGVKCQYFSHSLI